MSKLVERKKKSPLLFGPPSRLYDLISNTPSPILMSLAFAYAVPSAWSEILKPETLIHKVFQVYSLKKSFSSLTFPTPTTTVISCTLCSKNKILFICISLSSLTSSGQPPMITPGRFSCSVLWALRHSKRSLLRPLMDFLQFINMMFFLLRTGTVFCSILESQ